MGHEKTSRCGSVGAPGGYSRTPATATPVAWVPGAEFGGRCCRFATVWGRENEPKTQETCLRDARFALSFFWDRRIGRNPKGLRQNRAKDPETIALVFLRKVKPRVRMRRGAIVATTGHDAWGGCTKWRWRRERG
jgi:hypothetical protein